MRFRRCRSSSVLTGSVAVIREWTTYFTSYGELTAISTRADLRRSRSHDCSSLQRGTSARMSALCTAASVGECSFWPFYLQLWANSWIRCTRARKAWARCGLIADYSPLMASVISLHPQQPPPSAVYRLTAGHSTIFDGRRLFCGLIIHHQQTFWHFLTLPCHCFRSHRDLFAWTLGQWTPHWNVFCGRYSILHEE